MIWYDMIWYDMIWYDIYYEWIAVQLNIQISRGRPIVSTHFRWSGRSNIYFTAVHPRIQQWKNYRNWFAFARVMRHNVRAPFLLRHSVCMSVYLFVCHGKLQIDSSFLFPNFPKFTFGDYPNLKWLWESIQTIWR